MLKNMEKSLDASLVAGLNEFAASLFSSVTLSSVSKNVFVSPFSVSTCLGMLMLGTRSESRNQIFTRLSGTMKASFSENDYNELHQRFQSLLKRLNTTQQTDETESPNVSLLLSNMILIQENLGASSPDVVAKFKQDAATLYLATVNDVDFEGDGQGIVNMTNDWVKKSTNGLIEKFLENPPGADSRALLLNAIYFKGKWETPFDSSHTTEESFYDWDGKETKTQMMKLLDQGGFKCAGGKMAGQNVQVLDIPYDSEYVFTLVLPKERDGLKKVFEKYSDSSQVSAAVSEVLLLQTTRTSVDLYLPKFKMEKDIKLDSVLQELGIKDVYCPTQSDLSGMNGLRNLYVSSARHKSVVEVNEEGTEAAAATSIEIMTESMYMPTQFRADHPFLFFIRGCSSLPKERITLFSGIYAQVP